MSTRICRWPTGCRTQAKGDGYCSSHWQKLYRTGNLKSGFIDPGPVRAYVTEYVTRGGNFMSLATRARVSHTTISELYAGVDRLIRVGKADRILAVPMRPSNIGCVRRLNALAVLGHPMPVVAAAAMATARALHNALIKGQFTDAVAWQTVAAFDVLQGTPSRAKAAKYVARCAARRGAVSPFAWYGRDIDDPTASPDLGAETTITVADKVAEVQHLLRLGETKERACKQVGWAPETYRRALGNGAAA